VPFDVGVQAARELKPFVPPGATLTQFALRWSIDQPGVSTVIPGARNPDQVSANASAAALPPLTRPQLAGVRDVYDRLIRPHVHDRW
jgi:aryl-alcohol dehydrogenase-like predicted oxidoreductase